MAMRFGSGVALLAALIVLGACRQSSGDARLAAEAALREGVQQLRAGNYEAAKASFTKTLEHDPGSADAYLRRGLCHKKLGDLPAAEADYSQAIQRLTRPIPDPYALRASVRIARGNARGAIEDLDTALEKLPGDVSLLLMRAKARMVMGEPEGALSDLEPVKSTDPKSAPAWSLRGMYLAALGRESEAVAELEMAARLDPTDPWAALWLLGLGKGDSLLRQARPASPWHQQLVGFARGELSKDALLEEARRASLEPERADRLGEAHTVAALVAEGRGQQAEAKVHYRAIVEADLKTTHMHFWASRRLARLAP